MKRLPLIAQAACLTAAAATAYAQNPATPEPAPAPQAQAAASADVRVDAKADAAIDATAATDKKPLSDKNCVRETGTRIAARDGKQERCMPGRVYSKDDIDRTGQTNLADALRTLDPAIQ